MSKLAEINIDSHTVSIDGIEVENVSHLYLDMQADSVPTVDLMLHACPKYNGVADVHYWFESDSITECVNVIKFELQLNDVFADSLTEIIASKIDGDRDTAKSIIEEIIARW